MPNKIENTLPKPTGEFQVGICKYDLYDENRKTIPYSNGRLIPIQIYFPTQKGKHHPWPKVFESRAPKEFPPLNFIGHSKLLNLSNLVEGQHSIIIFNHGDNVAMTDYACIAEDLASHGLIVISIQSQLETDHSPKFWNNHSISKYACVIDNILYVFEWLKINKFSIFTNKINTNKIGLIGHSMGGNSLLMLANKTSSPFRKKADTLLPHETNQENIKECIIFIDGSFNYPRKAKYPILFCLSEENQHYQKQSGLLEDLNNIGYEIRYYKGSKHISFMDHGFINPPIPNDPLEKYFNGTKDECVKFWDLLRGDIRGFLQKNGIL